MADQPETVYVPASQIKANRLIGIATALTILVLDQLIKWVVTYIFQLRERLEITLLPIFKLSWTENRGVVHHLFDAAQRQSVDNFETSRSIVRGDRPSWFR